VLLFVIGLGLVFVDIFFVVGFGLLAVPGFALMAASIFLSLMGRMDLWTVDSVGAAARPILTAAVLTAILGFVMVRRLPKTRTWSRVVLHAGEEGFRASAPENESLMGREGIAFTALRPGGTGLFGDLRASVTTEGEYLEKNTSIRVVEVEGNRIVVRRA
jgi:membrane-bound serine protease (ClpP class)